MPAATIAVCASEPRRREPLVYVHSDGAGWSVFVGPQGWRFELQSGLTLREATLRAQQIAAVLWHAASQGPIEDPRELVHVEVLRGAKS